MAVRIVPIYLARVGRRYPEGDNVVTAALPAEVNFCVRVGVL